MTPNVDQKPNFGRPRMGYLRKNCSMDTEQLKHVKTVYRAANGYVQRKKDSLIRRKKTQKENKSSYLQSRCRRGRVLSAHAYPPVLARVTRLGVGFPARTTLGHRQGRTLLHPSTTDCFSTAVRCGKGCVRFRSKRASSTEGTHSEARGFLRKNSRCVCLEDKKYVTDLCAFNPRRKHRW